MLGSEISGSAAESPCRNREEEGQGRRRVVQGTGRWRSDAQAAPEPSPPGRTPTLHTPGTPAVPRQAQAPPPRAASGPRPSLARPGGVGQV